MGSHQNIRKKKSEAIFFPEKKKKKKLGIRVVEEEGEYPVHEEYAKEGNVKK